MTGYVLIARGMLKHPRFKPTGPFSSFEAWCWLIESAAYAPCDVVMQNGRYKRIVRLEPGQLSFSIRFLAKAWRWSENRVQRFLCGTQSDGSVTTQTDTGQLVITLCNWAKYQRPFANANTQTDTPTNTQTNTKKKEGIKEKNIQSSDDGFDQWYAIYPNKKNPADARKAYAKAIRTISLDLLLSRTKSFAATWAQEPKERRKFIPYPASWLNKGGHESVADDITPNPLVDPRAFTDDQWRRRLVYSLDADKWLPAWGPRPGMPGCIVPSHLILSPVQRSTGAA